MKVSDNYIYLKDKIKNVTELCSISSASGSLKCFVTVGLLDLNLIQNKFII